jgi:hypothetical protein
MFRDFIKNNWEIIFFPLIIIISLIIILGFKLYIILGLQNTITLYAVIIALGTGILATVSNKKIINEMKVARKQEYQRKIEVNLWLDDVDGDTIVHLCAFNSSYRSVTLIKCQFQVEGKPIDINRTSYAVDNSKYPNGPGRYEMRVTTEFNYPKHILKEGDTVFYSLKSHQLAMFLHYHGFNGNIKLNGFFKTAQKEKVETKSIQFNIEEYNSHWK